MCDQCPDREDLHSEDHHREMIRYYEQQAEIWKKESEKYVREAEAARRELRRRLRKGLIRSR